MASSRVGLDGPSSVEYLVVKQGVERWGVLAVDAFLVDAGELASDAFLLAGNGLP